MADIAFLTERMRLGFGADLVVDQIAGELATRGHQVTVYASYEDGTYTHRPYTLSRLSVPAIKYAPLYDAEAVRRARNFGLLNRGHELFFIASPPFFCLLPWLRHRAFAIDCGVIDSRGFPPSVRANFAFVEMAQHWVYFPFGAGVITISSWIRDLLPARLQPRAIPILLGGDHYPLAKPPATRALRRQLGIADDETMLLYLGRLNPSQQPYKGTAELLGIYQSLRSDIPKARLVMAGFGDDSDAAWVRSGGAVPYTNVPVDQMPALLGATDVFVTASRWEGFNLNVVEAQRAGAPVVAFRAGAHPEVIDDGSSGLLVESSRGFADALRELVRDEGRRREMSERARRWASRFRWTDTVDRYEEIVKEAGSQPQSA